MVCAEIADMPARRRWYAAEEAGWSGRRALRGRTGRGDG